MQRAWLAALLLGSATGQRTPAQRVYDELEAQVARLKGMRSNSMKPELRTWLGQRLNVLAQLKDEL